MHVLSELDPYFIAGMTDTYFDQTYRDRSSVPGYVRYKLRNICWQRAGALAQQRERARLAWGGRAHTRPRRLADSASHGRGVDEG